MSLANVVLGLVPLVSVVFRTMYLYHAREFIQMMLAQPVGRRSLFLGLYGGLAIPLAASFLFGVGAPLIWHGGLADAALPVFVLLGTGVALSLVFTGLAFVISLWCNDLAAAILVWLGAPVLYDGVVLLSVVIFRDYPLERRSSRACSPIPWIWRGCSCCSSSTSARWRDTRGPCSSASSAHSTARCGPPPPWCCGSPCRSPVACGCSPGRTSRSLTRQGNRHRVPADPPGRSHRGRKTLARAASPRLARPYQIFLLLKVELEA